MKLVRSTVAALAAVLAWGSAHAGAAEESPAQPPKPAVEARSAPEPAKGSEQPPSAATARPDGSGDKVVGQTMAPPPKPRTTLHIDVDLTRQMLTVKENGRVSGSWAISSGRSGYRTPNGTFRPQWMAKTWYSRKYDNSPMPNSIFFTGGFALHATYATSMLGRPASHGCVRQSPANAARLFAMVRKHGMASTKIVVHGSPRDREPAIARSSDPHRYARADAPLMRPEVRTTYARPQQNGFFSGLFADDDPRYVYVQPRRTYPVRRDYYGRPVYGFDSDGNRVRLR